MGTGRTGGASEPVTLIMDSRRFVGPALARLLAARGHRLALHDAGPDLCDALDDTKAQYVVVDKESVPFDGPGSIATSMGASALVAACTRAFGRVDAALVRPGNYVHGGINDISDEKFNQAKQNIDITFQMLRSLTKQMESQGGGSIVLCTSAYGARPIEGQSVYAGARAAENALMRSVALEFACKGICLNAVGTAYMKFPEFHGGWKDEFEVLRHETPRGELGTMPELAEFCGLLLEGRVRHLIGQFFSFSGGWG